MMTQKPTPSFQVGCRRYILGIGLALVLAAGLTPGEARAHEFVEIEMNVGILKHIPEDLACKLVRRDPGYVLPKPRPGRVIPERQRRRCLGLLTRLPVIPIVIYGSAKVDVRDINPETLRAGPEEAKPVPGALIFGDVDRDNREDMLFLVFARHTGLQDHHRFLRIHGTINGTSNEPATPSNGFGATGATGLEPGTVTGGASLLADFSPMTSLFSGLVEGAGRFGGELAFSYVLSLFGVTNETTAALQEVEGELASINEAIVNMNAEIVDALGDIDTDIDKQTCQQAFNNIKDDTDWIKNRYATLTGWTERTSRGVVAPDLTCPDHPDDTEECVEAWVTEVLEDSESTTIERLTSIHSELVGEGSVGLLTSCLALLSPPTANTFDDRDYYANVQNLMANYYGHQVRGLHIYVEAQHFRAWQDFVEADLGDLDVTTVRDICNLDGIESTKAGGHCDDAETLVHTVYKRLQKQFALAGLPYSSHAVRLQNGTRYLWVHKLDQFAHGDGFGCDFPLTSADPCGSTAGTYRDKEFLDASGKRIKFGGINDWPGYNNWEVAGPDAWTQLMAATAFVRTGKKDIAGNPIFEQVGYQEDQEVLDFMLDTLKFSQAEETIEPEFLGGEVEIARPRIFLTNKTSSTPIVSGDDNEYVCFIDTHYEASRWGDDTPLPPWCSETALGDADVDLSPISRDEPGDEETLYQVLTGELDTCFYFTARSDVPSPSRNDGFYLGNPAVPGQELLCDVWKDDVRPGWLASEERKQFRYPILDISKLKCTADLLCGEGTVDSTNVQGVPTMCGDDFDAYFETIAPSPTEDPDDLRGTC